MAGFGGDWPREGRREKKNTNQSQLGLNDLVLVQVLLNGRFVLSIGPGPDLKNDVCRTEAGSMHKTEGEGILVET